MDLLFEEKYLVYVHHKEIGMQLVHQQLVSIMIRMDRLDYIFDTLVYQDLLYLCINIYYCQDMLNNLEFSSKNILRS